MFFNTEYFTVSGVFIQETYLDSIRFHSNVHFWPRDTVKQKPFINNLETKMNFKKYNFILLSVLITLV